MRRKKRLAQESGWCLFAILVRLSQWGVYRLSGRLIKARGRNLRRSLVFALLWKLIVRTQELSAVSKDWIGQFEGFALSAHLDGDQPEEQQWDVELGQIRLRLKFDKKVSISMTVSHCATMNALFPCSVIYFIRWLQKTTYGYCNWLSCRREREGYSAEGHLWGASHY